MMRARTWGAPLVVAILIVLVAIGSLAAQKPAPSILGTWVGATEVPNEGTDQVTLTITKTKTGLAGTVADSLGQVAGTTEIKDLTFVDNSLTGTFPLADGAIITLKLKLDGDTLKGVWERDAGGTGDLTLERKKK